LREAGTHQRAGQLVGGGVVDDLPNRRHTLQRRDL
jgi:hypothetical protein